MDGSGDQLDLGETLSQEDIGEVWARCQVVDDKCIDNFRELEAEASRFGDVGIRHRRHVRAYVEISLPYHARWEVPELTILDVGVGIPASDQRHGCSRHGCDLERSIWMQVVEEVVLCQNGVMGGAVVADGGQEQIRLLRIPCEAA